MISATSVPLNGIGEVWCRCLALLLQFANMAS